VGAHLQFSSMPRSVWKGPYVAVSLLQDVIAFARRNQSWWQQGRFQGVKAPEIINTHCRSSVLLPDFLNCKFGVSHLANASMHGSAPHGHDFHALSHCAQSKFCQSADQVS
jgi:ribosomal protein S19